MPKFKKLFCSLKRMLQLKRISIQQLHAQSKDDVDAIVSFTSIPSRLKTVEYTVRSVLSARVAPKKMVLWLHSSTYSSIPTVLSRLVGPKFEIAFTDLDSSHCKLVPSLLAYPDDVIITCDDDLMYEPNWLHNLWQGHMKDTGRIVANRVRMVSKDTNGGLLRYKQWEKEYNPSIGDEHYVALGYGGVVYPPNVLSSEATNNEQYMLLAPKADDLWFKAMAYLNKAQLTVLTQQEPLSQDLPYTQKVSLRHENIKQDRNTKQWLALVQQYPQLSKIGCTPE